MCLAIAGFIRGYRVLVADVDPQRSSAYSLRNRKGPGPLVIETSGSKIHQVKYAAEIDHVDLLLIDTPGTADANTLHAIHAADSCLIVSRPNFFDLAGAVESANTARQLNKSGMVVLNQAPCERAGLEPPLLRSAREALLFTKMPVANVALRARNSYETSIAMGLSPEEAKPMSPAAGEVAQLWREFAQSLGLNERKTLKARAGR
jgi:chromosome partitioning protein